MARLAGKKICITGGGQGLGKAFALAFMREGAAVAVIDVNPDAAKNVPGATSVVADLSRRGAAHGAVNEAAEALGGLTGLVNNAVWARYLPLGAMDEDTLNKMLDAGLKTAFWSTQAALPWLAKAQHGSIINLSSVVGITGIGYSSAYAILKAGIDGLTRAWAVEFGRHGIRVNSIAPSAIPSPMSKGVLSEAGWESRRKSTPLQRIGSEVDVANAGVFLMSDESSFMTGDVLRVDGGFSIGGVIPGHDMPTREDEEGLKN